MGSTAVLRRLAACLAILALWASAASAPVRAAALSALPVGTMLRYAASPLRGYLPLQAPVAAVGRTLLLCDSPESVPGPGLLYRDRVQGPFRVFLYALNASPRPLRFAVVVSNASEAPASLDVSRAGIGGPSSRYFGVAMMAQAHYFASRPLRVITIPPHGSVLLDPAVGRVAAHHGQLVNAIIDASAASAPLWVSVVAERHLSTDTHGMPLLAPGPGRLMRGTFPNADFDVGVSKPGGSAYLLVGENPRYLHGYSWVDHRITVDYGNYGVLYNVRIYARTPAAAPPGRLTVLFAGRGVSYAGLALLSSGGAGRPVVLAPSSGGVALTPYEAVVLAHAALHPGQTAFVDMEWMPAGASTLPAAFLLAG